jgi:hypothetical protein
VVEVLLGVVGLGTQEFLAPGGLLAELSMREVVATKAMTYYSLCFQAPFARSRLPDWQEGKLLEYALWECMVSHTPC